MKNKLYSLYALFILICDFSCGQNSPDPEARDNRAIEGKVTADLVSSYIWRGTIASPIPNIQPTIAAVAGKFEAGIWGSTDFLGSYKEVDPYIAYSAKFVKLTFTDYCWTFNGTSYFNYKNAETNHILEGTIGFSPAKSIPLTISVSTMFYGADKKWDKESGSFSARQNYSTYIEVSYTIGMTSFLAGMTPSNGYYGAGYGKVDGFAVCNIGVASVRNINITPSFQLPLKGAVYVNPQAESIHFVIGLTL